MKKGLKYTLVSLGSLVVLAGVGVGIMYVVSPNKVRLLHPIHLRTELL
jgi:hypothetical protein